MNHDEPELVWQGRLHLGDGPGVYGDATYVGLSVELPLMLRRFTDAQGTEAGMLLIETEGLHTRLSSTGPSITVARYAVSDTDGVFEDQILLEQPLTEPMSNVRVDLSNESGIQERIAISLRLQTNTDAEPGLYADFVLVAIRFECRTHYASLGYQLAT